jgi:hypothetical protein
MKRLFVATLALLVPAIVSSHERERAVFLDDVPEPARQAILREAGEHKVLEVDEVTVEGLKYYDAEWREGGKEVEVTVTADGKVVGRESEDEDQPGKAAEDESESDDDSAH